MPLIHIYLNEGKSPEYRSAVSDALHEAFLETWNIPLKDRFHIFHETKPADLQIDKEMWDVQRSDDVIVFHVHLTADDGHEARVLRATAADP